MSVKQKIEELIGPVISALGCELWGLEYFAQGRHSVLRVYIEKEPNVELEDCEKVSRQVSSLLDVEDPISGKYTLEVSSPGMDRALFTLDHYQRFKGSMIALKLTHAFEGQKKFKGVLSDVVNDEVILQVGDEEYVLPFEWIDRANVVPQF